MTAKGEAGYPISLLLLHSYSNAHDPWYIPDPLFEVTTDGYSFTVVKKRLLSGGFTNMDIRFDWIDEMGHAFQQPSFTLGAPIYPNQRCFRVSASMSGPGMNTIYETKYYEIIQ